MLCPLMGLQPIGKKPQRLTFSIGDMKSPSLPRVEFSKRKVHANGSTNRLSVIPNRIADLQNVTASKGQFSMSAQMTHDAVLSGQDLC
jgi:hypothetical protein